MADDKSLFKWSRISEPRTYSRKSNVTKTEDIEKWLDRIDTAATRAVVNAAKKKDSRTPPPSSEVYGEARHLLNSWLAKKDSANLNEGDGFHVPAEGPDRLAIKREWDRLLSAHSDPPMNAEEEEDEAGTLATFTSAPLSQLAAGEGLAAVAAIRQKEEWEESESVETIMRRMLAKDYVNKRKLRRMEETMPTPRSDLKTKLELRQERAREARERRRQLEDDRRKEKALKKEAELEARKMLMEEERRRIAEAKREEEIIQKEMVRIRKEMQEAKRREEEAAILRREREEEERSTAGKATDRASEAAEEEKMEEEEERQSLVALQRRKEEIMSAVQRGERRQASRNLKLELFRKRFHSKVLQRCFAAWFSLVLDRRLQLGRAAAISDWRLLRTTFHGWRDLVRCRRMEAEAVAAARRAVLEQRNLRTADAFARGLLLRRCFASWRHFAAQERLQKAETAMELQKKRKMAAFLQAAAASAAKKEEEEKEEIERREREIAQRREEEEKEEEEEVEAPQPVSPRSAPSPARPRRRPLKGSGHREPSDGHSRALSAGSAASDPPSARGRPAKVPNNFEHRYRTQQEALREQSRRLDEQARLIEELRYEQRQAELKREVDSIRAAREKVQARPRGNKTEEAGPEGEAEMSQKEEEEAEDAAERPDGSSHSESSRTALPKKDPILRRMEQRAAERAKVKAERDEKRKLAEQKKAAEAAAHLEEQQRREEEEKVSRLREIRERRRLEQKAEQERLAAVAKSREQNRKADEFRQKAQLRWRGVEPWRRVMALRRLQEEIAREHYERELLRRCFHGWLEVVCHKRQEEETLVQNFRARALIRRVFDHWRLAKFYAEAMELKAQNFYECAVQRRTLLAWSTLVKDQLARRWDLEMMAKNFYNERLLKRTFAAWKALPYLQREERAREQRRDAIRRRVQALIPDFRPPTPPSDSLIFEL